MASPIYPMPTPSWLRPQASQKASGLLGLLGMNANPVTDFLGNNSNALIGFGAGLAGGGPGLGNAIGSALTGAGQGKLIDTQRSQTVADENKTRAWLQANRPDLANLPVDEAWQIAMKDATGSTDTPEQRAKYATQFGLTGDEAKVYTLTGKLPGRDNGETWYGNIVQYQNPDGTISDYQVSNQGNLKKIDAGGGAIPAVPVTYQNTGTAMTPVPKFGGAPTNAAPIPIDNSGKAFGTGVGDSGAKRFDTYQKDAEGAYGTLNTLNQMEGALKDPSFYSGFGANQVLAVKQMAVALGADPNAAAATESFNAASKKVILDGLGGSLGTAISNSDRDFIGATAPNLGNTQAGNQQLIEIARKLAQRKIEVATLAAQYVQEKGSLDANWPLFLKNYAEQNPLFASAPSTPQQGATKTYTYNPATGQLE